MREECAHFSRIFVVSAFPPTGFALIATVFPGDCIAAETV